MKKTLRTIFLLVTVTAFYANAQKARKVLIIGIDGTLNAGLTQTWAPNIYALMNDGHSYVSTDAQTDIPTISGNGWSGIMTGVGITKHKQPNNSFQTNDDYANYPSFYREIIAKYPTLRTVSIASWLPINKYIIKDEHISHKNVDPTIGDDNTNPDYVSDEIITLEAIDELTNNNPGVLFVHLDDVDGAGHGSGFSISNANYTAAITAADLRVKRIFDALKARPTYQQEDWLIAITTDHGGSGTSHGGSTYQERNTFIILNNIAIAPTHLTAPAPTTVTENVLLFPGSQPGIKPDLYGELPTAIKSKINFGSESFTIQAKIRMLSDASLSYPPIISDKNWNSGANAGFALAWHSNSLKFNMATTTNLAPGGVAVTGGSRGTDLVTGIGLADKEWHYVTIVVDRTLKRIQAYEQGILKATKDITYMDNYVNATTTFPVNIAADGQVSSYVNAFFKGNIQQVRIYKAALSAADVSSTWNKESYNSGDVQWANLVYYNTGLTFNSDKSGLSGETVGATNGVNGDIAFKNTTGAAFPTTMSTDVSQQFLVQKTEQSVSFTGTKTGNKPNLYGELPKASTTDKIDFGTEDFTIQLRVKMDNATSDNYPPIISNKDWNLGANTGFALVWHTQTLKFNFTTTPGTRGTDLDTQIDLADKRWHYITIVVKRSNDRIYAFDGGVLKAIKDIAYMNGLNATTTFPINIAADGMAGEAITNYATTYFKGNINHVRIFKGALSEKEIRANWKNDNLDANAPEWSKLVFYNKGNVLSADKLTGVAVSDGANTDIALKTNGAGVIPTSLSTITANMHDEQTPPFTYSVPATVLRFLDVPIPANYDGEVLAGVTANPANSPLPVKLISFTAEAVQSGVSLKWKVGTEDNVNAYDVLRKVGTSDFVKIGSVKARGIANYGFTDPSPIAGVNYYRLKVVDNDGAFKLEDPKAVNFDFNAQEIVVYPNPIQGNQINISLKKYSAGKYNYTLNNAAGSTVQKGSFNYDGASAATIKVAETLGAGVYILQVNKGSESFQVKLVK